MRNVRGSCLLLVSCGAIFFVGCGGIRHDFSRAAPQPALPLVWPEPPAQPRIRFLESITTPPGAGARKTYLRRLAGAFFGRSVDRLIRPVGLAGRDGMLLLADAGGQTVYLFNLATNSSQKITSAAGAQLVSPIGVALGDNRIYVSDSHLGRVLLYDLRGRFLGSMGERELERPTGLAVDRRAGRLYVADTTAHRIAVYDMEGQLQRFIGARGTGDGEFNFPTYVLVDEEGFLHVVDSLNYRIQTFDRSGRFASKFGHQGDGSGHFASPKGISMDSQGHLYVVDALFDTVQVFDQRGALLLTFGERGGGAGQFWLPTGLHIDDKDRIYVADSFNQRIQVFQFLGNPDGRS
ncbi:MAG: 6-bladed beta-propeller [Acidobacteriota bacterium]